MSLSLIFFVIWSVAVFLAGVLIGRINPDKVGKLAKFATKIKKWIRGKIS